MMISNNREPRPSDGEPAEETSLLAGQEAVEASLTMFWIKQLNNYVGEALAAMALIRSTAEVLLPLIVGSLMNVTIDIRLPQAVFFIAAILLFIGAGIIILVRDQDRFIPPEEVTRNAGFEGDCLPEDHEVGTN